MQEILRSNDVVYISWISALLADSGIEVVMLDTHMSVLEGSVSAIPRRLMVADEQYDEAAALVQAAEDERITGSLPDFLLDGAIMLKQPKKGYRAAIDPVMLAASVPESPGGTVLDLGCGVGTAALCYAHRVEAHPIIGLEQDAEFAALAAENVRANGLEDRITISTGDLLNPPAPIAPGFFQHVMANPPYVTAEKADSRMDPARRNSHIEGDAKLADWIACAQRLLVHKGSLTIIFDATRLDDLLIGLQNGFGGIVVFPLWPAQSLEQGGQDAKRVIIQARKGVRTPLRMASGLVLHQADGSYTGAAERVLRDGAALVL
jgi:tRNA1(Val) A37 N6-methylase TrmN6